MSICVIISIYTLFISIHNDSMVNMKQIASAYNKHLARNKTVNETRTTTRRFFIHDEQIHTEPTKTVFKQKSKIETLELDVIYILHDIYSDYLLF